MTHYSSYAFLAALGAKLNQIKFLEPIRQKVHIRQKDVKRSPFEKLTDALIAILSGAHGLVEINTRLRSDKGLQKAFGRRDCAEQSVVQTTLNACDEENVEQMYQALKTIFQTHSQTFRHNYQKSLLLIDIDTTGIPCGKKSEGSLKGYQGNVGVRYGRQLCRVLAAQYEEIIIDRLYHGTIYLNKSLQPAVIMTEDILSLPEEKRNRVVIRVDSGGSGYENIEWLLKRGYHLLTKDHSPRRAEHCSHGVKNWIADPKHPGRELGWLAIERDDYSKIDETARNQISRAC